MSFVQVSLNIYKFMSLNSIKIISNLIALFVPGNFQIKKILDAHITSMHQKENSKLKTEREPSISNHKQKKYNI